MTLLEQIAWNSKKFVPLGPFLVVMNAYRKGKFSKLFAEIDIDLRNAVVHFSFDFLDDEISYDGKSIPTLDFVSKYRKVAALFAVLFSSRVKAFAKEFEEIISRSDAAGRIWTR